jgi:hypothetical protein
MSRESLESSESAEKFFEFGEDVCCALRRGFEQNPSTVKQLIQEMGEKGEQKVAFFKELLLDPEEGIDFNLQHELKTTYNQIAKRELERIQAEDEDDEDLKCGHSLDEHMDALEYVVEKTEPTVH